MAVTQTLLGPADIRELARRLGVRPTKTLGQNFVIDANTVRRIVRTAAPAPDDIVVEVGPGLGSLTLALLPVVRRLVAIEIDGWAFHSDADTFRKDRARQNAIVLAGWTVLRFTWHDLTVRPSEVVADIRAALAIRAAS